jgi:hypothetical protein
MQMFLLQKKLTIKENKITVTTNNLNGQPEPTDVSIKIYDLVEPLNPKKARLWNNLINLFYQNQNTINIFNMRFMIKKI